MIAEKVLQGMLVSFVPGRSIVVSNVKDIPRLGKTVWEVRVMKVVQHIMKLSVTGLTKFICLRRVNYSIRVRY